MQSVARTYGKAQLNDVSDSSTMDGAGTDPWRSLPPGAALGSPSMSAVLRSG